MPINLLFIVSIIVLFSIPPRPLPIAVFLFIVLSNRDLDSLSSERPAKTRAFNDARKAFGTEDLEDLAEGVGKNGREAGVELGVLLSGWGVIGALGCCCRGVGGGGCYCGRSVQRLWVGAWLTVGASLLTEVHEIEFKSRSGVSNTALRACAGNQETNRKLPSVRTLRSCITNQTPCFSWSSCRRNALALRLPIKFRVKALFGDSFGGGCRE